MQIIINAVLAEIITFNSVVIDEVLIPLASALQHAQRPKAQPPGGW